MSQATVVLPTSGVVSGLTFATDINAALDSLRTSFTGASAPSADTPEEGQWWLDTSNVGGGGFPIIREYDGSAWIAIGVLDTTSHTILPNTGPLKTTTGTSSAYVLDTTPYEPIATPTLGFRIRCKIHTANAGACTLVVNGGTVYPLRTASTVDLTANNLAALMIIEAEWVASEWLIVNAISPVIANAAITYAKIQNVTNARLLGNFSGGSTSIQEVSLGTGLTVTGSTAPVLSASAGAPPTISFYSTSQTITIPAGVGAALVDLWAGGGGSGGTGGGGGAALNSSGGGGGGGWLKKYLAGLTAGNTLVLTVGAGGTKGSSAATSGSSGGLSSLASGTQTITTLTAIAGSGSAGSVGAPSAGGIGGGATNGDVNMTGQTGAPGMSFYNGTTSVGYVVPGGVGWNGMKSGGDGTNAPGNTATAGSSGINGGCEILWIAST